MLFSATSLLNFLLLTSIVSARPSGLVRRTAQREARKGNPLIAAQSQGADKSNTTHVEYSSNWSGAVLESPPAGTTFQTVVGTFTVPTPSGGSASSTAAAAAWVGIDGDTYQKAILQAGVDFNSGSSVTYDAWYEWYPDYAYDFSGIPIQAGDVITVTIAAASPSKGTVTIENVTTGKTVSETLSAPDSSATLGGQNAEWIVEDFEEGDSLVPFANFDTVTFSNAVATTSSGTSVGLTGAATIDIEQNNKILTSVTINSASSVTIDYV